MLVTERKKQAAVEKKTYRLTLCGSFGLGNTGDEALPSAVADLARAHDIDVRIASLSRYDEPTLAGVIGLSNNEKHRRRELAGSPCMIIGGGVVEPSRMSVLLRCMPAVRKLSPSLVSLFAASAEAGVPYSFAMRRRIRKTLHGVDPLYVRDDLSAEILGGVVPRRRIEVVGDAVLWLRPEGPVPAQVTKLKRFIAVSLAGRWSHKPGWYAWVAEQLFNVAQRLKAPLLFLPLSWLADDDRREHQRVAEVLQFLHPEMVTYRIEDVLAPRQVVEVLRRATLTIAMRLHASVMSFAQRTPFVAIAYHPKIAGFARTVGWGDYVLPHVLPDRQGSRTYGYEFSGIKPEENLAALCERALEYSSFERLDELREKLAHAFIELMNRSDENGG